MEAASFLTDAAERPDTGAAYWVTASDGVRLRVGLWPDGDKGTVLLFPGRTEYVEKYGPAAQEFARAGLATATIDWRGQGLADKLLDDPMIGHVGRFSDYQLDVTELLAAVRAQGLPEPYYLVAHSMGGAIGSRALLNGLPVKAAVLSAPLWGILFEPGILKTVAWALSTLAHNTGLGKGGIPGVAREGYIATGDTNDNVLTHDPAMFRFMQDHLKAHPELELARPSYTWLNEALRETWALRKATMPDIPTLVTLGSDESVVESPAIHHVTRRWPSSELVLYDNCHHEIMMETADLRDAFYESAIQFLLSA